MSAASSTLFVTAKPIESEEDDLVFTLNQHSKKECAQRESEYSFYKRSKAVPVDPLIETNIQEAQTLNASSASCLQFALSEEEQQQITRCDKTSEEIEQQVRVLGLTRLINGKIKKALQLLYIKMKGNCSPLYATACRTGVNEQSFRTKNWKRLKKDLTGFWALNFVFH